MLRLPYAGEAVPMMMPQPAQGPWPECSPEEWVSALAWCPPFSAHGVFRTAYSSNSTDRHCGT